MNLNLTFDTMDLGQGSAIEGGETTPLTSSLFALLNAKTILLLLVTLYLAQVGYYCFVHPLRKVPGPSLARYSQAWRNIRYFRGSWLQDVVALHEK